MNKGVRGFARLHAALLLFLIGPVFASPGPSCWPATVATEVVVQAQTDFSSCPPSLGLAGTRYFIEATGNRPVIGGCLASGHIPTGYTYVSAGFFNCGPWMRVTWYLNRHPVSRAFGAFTPVNTSVSGSASTTDPDNNPLTYSVASITQRGGQVSVNFATGAFVYMPPASFTGEDWFRVRALDGRGGEGSVEVYMTVGTTSANLPPVFQEYTIRVDQDSMATMNLHATDPEAGPVTVRLDPARPPQHGTLIWRNDPQFPIYSYQPFPGYFGDDSFGAIATDNRGNTTSHVYPIVVMQYIPPVAPSAPESLTVPATSDVPNYTISWGAATANGTPITDYQTEESTNANFTGATRQSRGVALSTTIFGKTNGTYYYRIRACSRTACSNWLAGTNGVVVVILTAPSTPSVITVPSSSSTGNFSVSWNTAAGTVTSYELHQSMTNAMFNPPTVVYKGMNTSSAVAVSTNGTYYYRVRACNGSVCSADRYSAGVVVNIPLPGIPASITVPSSTLTGGYTVSWGGASGIVTRYDLYEATNPTFTGAVRVHNGSALSASFSGKTPGSVYYYRVAACNNNGCGSFQTGANGVSVSVPAPTELTVPASSSTGAFTVSWGSAAGTVTSYALEEDITSTFSAPTLIYSGMDTSLAIAGKTNGNYYYRVKACNGIFCSAYTSSAGIAVNIPVPSAPGSITVPSASTGDYAITWDAAAGVVARYELYEATDSGFATTTLVQSDNLLSSTFSARPEGMYFYQVRACNSSGCGTYRDAGNSVVVTAP